MQEQNSTLIFPAFGIKRKGGEKRCRYWVEEERATLNKKRFSWTVLKGKAFWRFPIKQPFWAKSRSLTSSLNCNDDHQTPHCGAQRASANYVKLIPQLWETNTKSTFVHFTFKHSLRGTEWCRQTHIKVFTATSKFSRLQRYLQLGSKLLYKTKNKKIKAST